MNYLIAILLTVVTGTLFACSEDGKSGFLPENDLYIPVGPKMAFGSTEGLTESQFNTVIDKVETIYSPIVSEMGGVLKINRKWDDGTVNANAMRLGSWLVNMYGGLARHATITEDGFALVLCHEIGHHLGGAPKISLALNPWASNEGQADYFAALKCLRKTFLNDDNIALVKKMSPPKSLTNACKKAWSAKEDRAICVRNGMAGLSVAKLFAALKYQPEAKFETPDTSVVTQVDDSHPIHQCRLDTFLQGALCEVGFNEDLSQKDEVQGTCHGSLGHTKGLRPLCWFKPKI